MEDNHEQFRAIVNNSPFLTEKWGNVFEQVKADGLKYYSVELTEADVMALSEARIWALGNGELDRARYEAEFQALPAFREVIQLRKVVAGDVQAQAEAVLSVLHLKPSDRISQARRLGVASVVNESEGSGLSRADTLSLLMTMPASQRLSFARKWNVL